MCRQKALEFLKLPFIFLLFIYSTSCNINSRPIELGEDLDTSPTDIIDSFVIEFALRRQEPSLEEERSIIIQLRRFDSNLDNLESLCSVDASKCECQLFSLNSREQFVVSEKMTINEDLNILRCEIPDTISNPDTVTHVRIVNEEEKIRSGRVKILNALSLTEVMRGANVNKVRRVYRYRCTRTFLEGLGVTENSVTCLESMLLSFLLASYHYYLFAQLDGEVDNFSDKGGTSYYGDEFFDGGLVCGLRIPFISCGTVDNFPSFGLSEEQNDLFSLGIGFFPYPEFLESSNQALPVYGFAAVTDKHLNCPPGLVKINPYVAVPASHLDPDALSDASNFINSTGRLNDVLFQSRQEPTPRFQLRKRNASAECFCDRQACYCPQPVLNSSIIQEISYELRTPSICVIPAELLR